MSLYLRVLEGYTLYQKCFKGAKPRQGGVAGRNKHEQYSFQQGVIEWHLWASNDFFLQKAKIPLMARHGKYLSHTVYDESENRANMEMIQMCGENESLLVDAVLPD